METEKDVQSSDFASIGKYCPNEGSRMVYKESLTNDPELSGWECPVCLFCFYEE